MSDYTVLWRIRLREDHKPTGRTRHFIDGKRAPVPAELRIVAYEAEQGFYLLYCDESGQEFTDTYHESIEDAKAQAKWEFEVGPGEWESCGRR